MIDRTTAALSRAFAHANAHLNGLDTAPVCATADLMTLRQRLGRPFEEKGIDPEQVIDELVSDVSGGILGSAGGRFFGWVIGGALPSALAADWLASAYDQNAALYACGPAAAVVEEVAGAWTRELLGLPTKASFALTTGCQMAHFTCLAAARHALLKEQGWDVEERGLVGAPQITVLTGEAAHGSIDRAIRLLGLGSRSLVVLATDEHDRLSTDALVSHLESRKGEPQVVVLQAGDINTGAFDDFGELIPLAKKIGSWVHVDGAFGLWSAASPVKRHLVKDVHLADSWATDGHKWLNLPYDCGIAFVADPEGHRGAVSHRASYLTHDEDARDQIDWNPDWSRRARGFALYAALRELGRSGVAELIDRTCRHAKALVDGMSVVPGVEVLSWPTLNQGLVRFPDLRAGASELDHDRHTDAVIARVVATGEAFFGGTTWRGRRAMRISVCNWRTNESDVRRAVEAVKAVVCKPRIENHFDPVI
ncbi:pyridoxal-dependent decarboxylase [Chelativorans sp.]|uniref:pyridoxal phosphate-dependent decarboxylase family protein n=1 Tax=Chelativorans sp. TaxID=2203393 RepID=UPI0028120523|nr:pyridoxal-dependent decarboxylase [Chelativorans sp.]